jgi:hypothetical protein
MNLIPCVPLSFERRGGRDFLREASPLFDSLVFPLPLFKGRGFWRGGFAPSLT